MLRDATLRPMDPSDVLRLSEAGAATNVGWRARLELGYASERGRTVPVLRRHHGPLRVQKGLLPEGPHVWHQMVVHPPGGVAAGDRLDLTIHAASGSHVLLTCPGAAKWYRSAADFAEQTLSIEVDAGATVEWLPPENIVFDGAHARMRTVLRVAPHGTLIATELFSLGRPACGERFLHGELRSDIRVLRDRAPLFVERAVLPGGHRLLDSPVGLAGRALFGMLLAVSDRIDDAVVTACRAATASAAGELAITRRGSVLLARWRGARADDGLRALRAVWAALRPMLVGREAVAPRIWST